MEILNPIQIGPSTAPNRILFGPHLTNLGDNRGTTENWVAYYGSRISGGAGVVVTEEASVDPSDWPFERSLLAERAAPGWRSLSKFARQYGTILLAGIGHSGGEGSSAYSQRPLFAPSPVPEVTNREIPKELELFEIASMVDSFARSAQLAMDCGLQGVELNIGVRSLLRQFLSPLTNHRSDNYGEDRSRFLTEVIEAVRVSVGAGIVGVRLTLDEFAPWGGLTTDQLCETAKAMSRSVDMFVVTSGSIFTRERQRPDFHTPEAFNAELSLMLKGRIETESKIFVQGSIVTAANANQLIAQKVADGVEMTRAQIAEPAFVNNLKSNKESIPCVLCNQYCQVQDSRNPRISCLVNPNSGHELSTTKPTRRPESLTKESISIVGAGPAGLELAVTLRRANVPFEIFERGSEPGGTLKELALKGVGGNMSRLNSYYRSLLADLEIDVHFKTEISEDEIKQMASEFLVIQATGSEDRFRADQLANRGVREITSFELLKMTEYPREENVVLDDRLGNHESAWATEIASQFATHVHLVTADPAPFSRLSNTGDLMNAIARTRATGAEIHTLSKVRRGAFGSEVNIQSIFGQSQLHISDPLLISVGSRSIRSITADAKARHHLIAIGDCLAPRNIHYAILEARAIGKQLVELWAPK